MITNSRYEISIDWTQSSGIGKRLKVRNCSPKTYLYIYTYTRTHNFFFYLMILDVIFSKECPGPKGVKLWWISSFIYNEGRVFNNRRFWLMINNFVNILVLQKQICIYMVTFIHFTFSRMTEKDDSFKYGTCYFINHSNSDLWKILMGKKTLKSHYNGMLLRKSFYAHGCLFLSNKKDLSRRSLTWEYQAKCVSLEFLNSYTWCVYVFLWLPENLA